jgi:serine/threonine protein phosphatase 1
MILADAAGVDHNIVCVGDYVDRGEASADVLGTLHQRATATPDRFICLMGNHEKMMLDFLDSPIDNGPRWLHNGGLQTLASFGVGGVAQSSDGDRLLAAADKLGDAIGPDMLDWLRSLPLTWSSGTLWVVHAAAQPSLPMNMQEDRVLLWGHSEFFQTGRADGIWVAHGHTVIDQPGDQGGRIAVDTGAYFSGKLTAGVLEAGSPARFLQT